MQDETNFSSSCNFMFVALPKMSENGGMVSGLSPLNSLQLQKLKVFAGPPFLRDSLFSLPPTNRV